MPSEDAALVDLLRALAARGYAFVTPTPATHARVVARPDRRQARNLAGVFGWSLPFEPAVLHAELLDLMCAGGVLAERPDGRLASRVRASTVRGLLFLHSAYPTHDEDAVFLGPDSWRFADFVAAELASAPAPRRLVDVGAGAGVGALTAAAPRARLTATDINAKALRLARVNAAAAGLELETVETDTLHGVEGAIDLVLANPPYIVDAESRTYRDGGDLFGGRISLDMAGAAAERLEPGGACCSIPARRWSTAACRWSTPWRPPWPRPAACFAGARSTPTSSAKSSTAPNTPRSSA
jgi:methylase of polypeptide subunit release factors